MSTGPKKLRINTATLFFLKKSKKLEKSVAVCLFLVF